MSLLPFKIISSKRIIKNIEEITLLGLDGNNIKLRAKVDSGADSTSLDETVAQKLGLLQKDNVVGTTRIKHGSHKKHFERKVVSCTFIMHGVEIKTKINISNRSHMNYKMLIGRKDMKGFYLYI